MVVHTFYNDNESVSQEALFPFLPGPKDHIPNRDDYSNHKVAQVVP
jgi:hypothetical protein